MILWRTKLHLPEEQVDEVISSIKLQCAEYGGQYSTYNTNPRPESIFIDTYMEVLANAAKAMGLYHRSSYRNIMWAQLYINGGQHAIHDHSGGYLGFSWVHFVKPTSSKCFHFVDSMSNKTYPDQDAGDFIVFPQWAQHAVDPNNTMDERFVIAGNILITELLKDDPVNPLKFITTTIPNSITVSQHISL